MQIDCIHYYARIMHESFNSYSLIPKGYPLLVHIRKLSLPYQFILYKNQVDYMPSEVSAEGESTPDLQCLTQCH